jgi:hypothetical protein
MKCVHEVREFLLLFGAPTQILSVRTALCALKVFLGYIVVILLD